MSDRYDSTRKAWEDIWDGASVEQELQTEGYARAQATIRAYTAHLAKDDLILEAGSGLSAALIILKRMGYRVTGLDYAENALHVSKDYDPSLVLATGDVHALPYADNVFGGYLSFGVLEHFEAGMAQPLAEAYRVLKPGGILVLTIPYPNVVNRLVAWRRKQAGRQRAQRRPVLREHLYPRQARSQRQRRGLRGRADDPDQPLVYAVDDGRLISRTGLLRDQRAGGEFRGGAEGCAPLGVQLHDADHRAEKAG